MKKGVALWLVLIGLAGLCVANASSAKAQYTSIYINPEGSVIGTNSIQRNGDLYVLTANISGSIAVQKSNIIIDGAGYTLQGNGGTGIDLTNNVTQHPSPSEIWNVTVKSLQIVNFDYSVRTNGGGNDTFYDDCMEGANTTNGIGGIFFWGSFGNNITYCTISGTPAIDLDFVSSNNNVTENNLSGGIWVLTSGGETIDRNYWSDYLTTYSNATEIDSSGIGNTPYVFYSNVLGSMHQDNHPLMKQVSIPSFGATFSSPSVISSPYPSSSPSPSPLLSPTIEPTSTPQQKTGFLGTSLPIEYGYAIVAVVVIIVVAGLSLSYFKRLRKKKS